VAGHLEGFYEGFANVYFAVAEAIAPTGQERKRLRRTPFAEFLGWIAGRSFREHCN
jgi:hypothetical protein